MGCVEAVETKGMGKGSQVTVCSLQSPQELRALAGSESEVRLVFLQLHHEVMDVDELGPGWECAELGLGQHTVEAMVELDQLGQRPLDDAGSVSKVGKTPHYILTQGLH